MKKVLCWNALCHLTAGCIIASTRTYYIFMCLLSMTVTVSRMTFLLVCFVMIHAGLQQLYCFPSFNEMWTDTTRCKIRWKFKDKMFFCVSLLIWRKRDFISSGNGTLCLKDTFEDRVVWMCLKYRMGRTGLTSAYTIKCFQLTACLIVNEANMSGCTEEQQVICRNVRGKTELFHFLLHFLLTFAACFLLIFCSLCWSLIAKCLWANAL